MEVKKSIPGKTDCCTVMRWCKCSLFWGGTAKCLETLGEESQPAELSPRGGPGPPPSLAEVVPFTDTETGQSRRQ